MRELLQIGEVAKLIGVSTITIRYYHEIGLLAEPKRTEGIQAVIMVSLIVIAYTAFSIWGIARIRGLLA